MTRDVAARLLRVRLRDVYEQRTNPRDRVPAVGARRRLQALVAIGYPIAFLGRRAGIAAADAIRSPKWVHLRVYRAVCAVYDELSMTPGPSAAARRLAESRGWPPPLAWDDDAIDDPTAVPLGDAPDDVDALVELVEAGEPLDLTRGTREALVPLVLARGRLTMTELAELLGVTLTTIRRDRDKAARAAGTDAA